MKNTNDNISTYFFSVSKKDKSDPGITLKALDELNGFFSHQLNQISPAMLGGRLKKDGIEEKIYVARTFQNEADLRELFKDFIKRFDNEGRILEIYTIQQYLTGG